MALDLKLHKRSEDSKFLVALIHGLGAPDTWYESHWIERLLQDITLTGVDVGVVRYDTAHLASGIFNISGTFHFFGREVTIEKGGFTSISDLAIELKRELGLVHIEEYSGIILVGHSMGGLIGAQYIMQEIANAHVNNIKGFVSIATPYNGAALAAIGKLFEPIHHHDQIEQLNPNSDFLDELIREWMKYRDGKILETLEFTFAYGLEDTIVPKTSAIPHTVLSTWEGEGIPGNHSTVIGVGGECNQYAYRLIRDKIQRVMNKVTSPGTSYGDIERSKKALFRDIKEILIENKTILDRYGPNSLVAQENPLSGAAEMWDERKKTTIIPNNYKIIDLIKQKKQLLTMDEYKVFAKFREHAVAFEENTYRRLESSAVPLFPVEFEEMINKEVE